MRTTSWRTMAMGMALVTASPALAGGGAGVTLGSGVLPKYGGMAETPAFGPMACIGGLGFGVPNGGGVRAGAELQYCRSGRGQAFTFEGGGQFGVQTDTSGFYVAPHATMGFGGMVDRFGPEPYNATYAYVKPAIGFGVGLGFLSFEAGPWVHVPVNLVQRVGQGAPRGIVQLSGGVQIAALIGDFRGRRPEAVTVVEPTTPPVAPAPAPSGLPYVVPTTPPQPQAPLGPVLTPSRSGEPVGPSVPVAPPEAPPQPMTPAPPADEDDRPLAIPGDAPPPPEPPPSR